MHTVIMQMDLDDGLLGLDEVMSSWTEKEK